MSAAAAERAAVRRVRNGKRYSGLASHRTMVRRLSAVLDGATADQWDAGMGWYARFAGLADVLAERHGVSAEDGAAVLAILSPQCSVGTSVMVADALLGAWSAGGSSAALAVRGVIGTNIVRAVAWLEGDRRATDLDVGEFTRARKVRSFFVNILGDPDAVTVDVWATRAVGGELDQPEGGGYVAVAEAYRSVARRYGIAPREAQAVAWCAVRTDIDAAAELDALTAAVRSLPVPAVPSVWADPSMASVV